MSRLIFSLIMFFFISHNLLMGQIKSSPQKTGNLTVIIKGLRNNKGNIQIGLFNSKEGYNGNKKKFKGAIIKIENKKVKWEIKNIPFGEYAIKAFHDEDSNNQINTNFLGIPVERYGFSNNAKGCFGPPGFDKAKFHFNSDSMKIEIHLK